MSFNIPSKIVFFFRFKLSNWSNNVWIFSFSKLNEKYSHQTAKVLFLQ